MINRTAFLSRALDNVAQAIWVLDNDITKVKFANRKLREFLSLPMDADCGEIPIEHYVDQLSRAFGTYGTPEGETQTALNRLRLVEKFDVIRETADGKYIKMERFPDEEGDAVITFSNVSDLMDALETAKKAEVAKAEFMANMSHEIRTPMNGVVGMAQVLARTELSDQQKKCVDVIKSSGESLVSIINDILDFSKLQSGKLRIDSEPFDAARAIEDVAVLLGYSAREKSLELILDMPVRPFRQYIGDAGRIRQVLINLLGNAIKFTHEGFVKLSVNITETDGIAALDFRIADTGIGMKPEVLSNIFNKFEQADSSTTRKFGGTGLGLSISRELVELMGGEISVESEFGKGSEFSINIQLPISDKSIEPITQPQKLQRIPILFVDDIPTNLIVMRDQIAELGAVPACVSSGEKALAVLRNAKAKGLSFPLVITDYQMPGMNGLDFVKQVRADPLISSVPIMVLSSVDLDAVKPEFALLGVRHIYEKPFLSHELHGAIVDILSENDTTETAITKGAPPSKPRAEKPDVKPIDRRIRILAVDDDAVNRLVLEELFDAAEFSVTIADGGRSAIDLCKARAFDVVLMDISMPDIDGPTAVAEIRKVESERGLPPVPIIATTAHALVGDRERFLEQGMNDYLPKPLDHEDVIETVVRWAENTGKRKRVA